MTFGVIFEEFLLPFIVGTVPFLFLTQQRKKKKASHVSSSHPSLPKFLKRI